MKATCSHISFLMLCCIIFFKAFIGATDAKGQTAGKYIREGNKLYREEKFEEAEIKYRKSLERKPDNVAGQFNLANTLYRMGKYDEASAILDTLVGNISSKEKKAKIYHNLGNNLLKNKDYERSIEAYKKAMKINSEDEDTRYNLAYAMEMLKQQKLQQQQQQNQKQDQQQDQKQSPNQDSKPQNEKEQQQQEPQRDKLSREDAERMLDALNQEEKELHKEKAKQRRVGNVKVEKDW